jgi:hypothetical protein
LLAPLKIPPQDREDLLAGVNQADASEMTHLFIATVKGHLEIVQICWGRELR